ncbi:MAG TPA: sigma-70 family RNA polymerase sigma factor [Solirubrobacteraceae bacterium]|nr:sigma-70 family RNA polymerase sigma factor [Solirubrobacteraceae bacterium]
MGGVRRTRPAVAAPAQSGPTDDDLARQELVRSHLPLVRAVARRYGGRGEDLEELVQVGSLALVKASGRFDPDRGVAFASFAAPAVEGGIRRHLRDRSGRTTRIASSTPEAGEVAAEPAGELDSIDESEFRLLLADGLRVLDERERRIVFLRFHADMTERQIATTIGISQAHVSRLLEGALVKLRTEFTASSGAAESGDSTETPPISPENGRKIEPVRARGQRNGATAQSADGPASDAGQRADGRAAAGESGGPSRRSGRSKAATGYSGRILVRMPSELHEQLAQAAERDEVSLNRFVTQALTTSVDSAGTPASDSDGGPAAGTARKLKLAVATNLVVVVLAAVAAVVLLVLALQRGL